MRIWIALFLLAAILGGSLFNIHYLDKKIETLTDMIEAAQEDAMSGQWKAAAEKAEAAYALWKKSDRYNHIFIRHTQIEGMAKAFTEYLAALYGEDKAAAKAACLHVKDQLAGLRAVEKIRLRNIF